MEQRYTFHVTTPLFFRIDSTIVGYSYDTIDEYIVTHKPYEALLEDVASSFDTHFNKCLENVSYDPSTRTVQATIHILITPGDTFFPGNDPNQYVEDLKDFILSTSFEDGCYGGDRASFLLNGAYVGVFDIRKYKTLNVELVATSPGPTREQYETHWAEEYNESTGKCSDAEALSNFKRLLATPNDEKRNVRHEINVSYLRREIYGLAHVYFQIEKSPFYKNDEERLEAYKRVVDIAKRKQLGL